MPQGAEWLIILAIVILLFGAAKLPDLARSTGRSLRIFKAETKGLTDDDDVSDDTGTASTSDTEPRSLESGQQTATTAEEAAQRQTDS
ncbi:MAG: twin-arginine translocase TatA/TatE family subunit [Propionibacteriales bacterium]|nr:twin-arginine translocase TatA/TatE family subunit [Propionibacteriales bacterium]